MMAIVNAVHCQSPRAVANGTLTIAIGSDPTLLNPVLSTDATTSEVEGFIFNGLIRFDDYLKIKPDLATSYSISSSGLVYTFYLRKDVKWQDGQPFTAADVKFTFDKILDPKTRTVRRGDFVVNGKPIVFKVLDPYTIQAILPHPFAPFLSNMGMPILPKHYLEHVDINTTTRNRMPIGTGPFKLDTWKPGQYIRLTGYDGYHGGKPLLKTLICKVILNPSTALAAYQNGELDLVGVMPKDFDRVRRFPHSKIVQYDRLFYTYLGFNLKHPVLADKTVRQAITESINKMSLVSGVLRGFGKPAYVAAVPGRWDYPEAKNCFMPPYSPAHARQLLISAGYRFNPRTKIFEKNGKALTFTLLGSKEGGPMTEQSAQMIQRYLQDVGIKINIRLMEWGSLLKIINSPSPNKDFDMVLLGWQLGMDPDSYSIWHSSQFPRGFNFIGYKNAKVDQLLDAGRRETHLEGRKKIYKQMLNLIAQDYPYVFLFHTQSLVSVRDYVGGLSVPGPLGLMNSPQKLFVSSQKTSRANW